MDGWSSQIYDYPDVPFDLLYDAADWTIKPYRKIRYFRQIVALDTETSQLADDVLVVTDWSLTMEEFGCIYGHLVRDLMELLSKICSMLEVSEKNKLVVYVHNLSYDYMFLRNHMFETFGTPVHSIATRPHKYISINFPNGLELRDSYILTARSLERFAADMGVPVQKMVGAWDYNKIRTPGSGRTPEEKAYACADTIALVQALRVWFRQHKCNSATVEYTNTGFVRAAGLAASKTDKSWRWRFRSARLDYDTYMLLEEVFHGGYTHANRYHIGEILHDVVSFDFSSSYPARMLYSKFPSGKWFPLIDPKISDIMELRDRYAFMGYLLLSEAELHRDSPMPPIMRYKCRLLRDPLVDNGRVVKASLLVVPFTDPDLGVILDNYDYEHAAVSSVMFTTKDYLPDWFCELIMELFRGKTTQKGKDALLYQISKGMLNSMYGMTVQKVIRDDVLEDYETGQWMVQRIRGDREAAQAQLDAFYKNRKKYLPFAWGVWVTAYAQEELFKLGAMCQNWIYSDTDSVKGSGWDMAAVDAYNADIQQKAMERGYGSLVHNGKTYTIGTAEFDGRYEEFVTLGSKRYCYREDGELHITVAGVPKIGVDELHDDIRNFRASTVFRKTNKTASVYIYHPGINKIIYNNEEIEYGCSIRLDPVEYTLDMTVQWNPQTGMPYSEWPD